MAPVIAVQINDGHALLAAGASGGRTIINNVATLVVGALLEGLGPEAVVAAPRLQCETREPALVERAAGAETIAALRRRGHQINEVALDSGRAHLIVRDGDGRRWHGAADLRLPGAATIVA
jgi:gamma-glutamyltranspeptidase/glutathione hydrolase